MRDSLKEEHNGDDLGRLSSNGVMKKLISFLLFCSILLVSCARSPIKAPGEALRPGRVPQLSDDETWESLRKGIEIQLEYWGKKPPEEVIQFGPTKLQVKDYIKALSLLMEQSNKEEFLSHVEENFEFYEVYGQDKWGEVFVTGYYEPLLKGSKKPNLQHSQALYKVPPDLVNIELGEFAKALPHWSPFFDAANKNQLPGGSLRGRYLPPEEKFTPGRVVPYFSRAEIDTEKKLQSSGLEIVYVDPTDAFFLQIQGSGRVELENGQKIQVGYAAQNGHAYVPIGKFLKDVIPIESMSKQAIEEHMRTQLDVEQRQTLMNKNPSYVFFRKLEGRPLTASGTEVVDGRTIATDWRYFSKGTLAFLEFTHPQMGEEHKVSRRFVFDQDTGGAIRGPGRVDLFCGAGNSAEEMAGHMRHVGKLWYLVPK